jgi:hypothetical protein
LFPWWREAKAGFFLLQRQSVKIKTNLLMAQEIFSKDSEKQK